MHDANEPITPNRAVAARSTAERMIMILTQVSLFIIFGISMAVLIFMNLFIETKHKKRSDGSHPVKLITTAIMIAAMVVMALSLFFLYWGWATHKYHDKYVSHCWNCNAELEYFEKRQEISDSELSRALDLDRITQGNSADQK